MLLNRSHKNLQRFSQCQLTSAIDDDNEAAEDSTSTSTVPGAPTSSPNSQFKPRGSLLNPIKETNSENDDADAVPTDHDEDDDDDDDDDDDETETASFDAEPSTLSIKDDDKAPPPMSPVSHKDVQPHWGSDKKAKFSFNLPRAPTRIQLV